MSALPDALAKARALASERRLRARALSSWIGWAASALAFGALALALLDILYVVFRRGFSALNWQLFVTPTSGIAGGLLNAIEGSALLTFGALLLAVPVGVLGGIYVSEFSRDPFARTVRFVADVLVGVPSIVFGLFGYLTMVTTLDWHFSLAAGCITLAMMIAPYMLRTTELAMRGVPAELREAGYALGASQANLVARVLLRECAPRVLTGILLAMAISMGETAPLIYTVNWSNYYWSGHLTHEPVAYLTYVIWSFINEPFASAHALAYAAALLITLFVLAITLLARLSISRLAVRRNP